MKTIRNTKTGEIKRLKDKEAHKMVVTQGYLGWSYVPKEVWKNEVRGTVNTQENKSNKKNENDTTTRKTSDVKIKKSNSR